MGEVADRYARIADGFTARLEGCPPGCWQEPSPCPDWNAREVGAHVVGTHRRVLGALAGEDPAEQPTNADDDDLTAAWAEVTAEVRAVLADDDQASATVQSKVFPPMPFEDLVSRLLCTDTLVHTWDLARASGQDEALDPAGVTYAYEAMLPNDEAIRRPGGFGPKVEPPAGADERTRFLAFLGRRAWA